MTRYTETDNERLERERYFTGHGRSTIAQLAPKRPQVGFKRLTEDAVIPTKAHASDSGYDLVASEDVINEPGATVVVPTGISTQLPEGFEATVRPRSGVTRDTKLRVQLGTIDNGFTGGIGVIVDNVYQPKLIAITVNDHYEGMKENAVIGDHTSTYKTLDGGTVSIAKYRNNGLAYEATIGTYLIRKGDRIAQIVITRLPDVEAIEVFDVEETARGDSGFGSSGVSAE